MILALTSRAKSMATDFDTIIIGAGAIGLACGWAGARSGRSVAVLERETHIGTGISSRNSEVIHAGLHYTLGSLKARFCVQGRRLLYEYLESRAIAHQRCGKLIVATAINEMAALEGLAARAQQNGVEGISWLSAAAAQALEPGLACVGALLSAQSGILDGHGLMAALAGDIEASGGILALGAPFVGASPLAGGGWRVACGGASPAQITAQQLILAAGLEAQACARLIEGLHPESIPRLHYGKGHYFSLARGRAPFSRLIYPPPIPGALGMHYRKDLGGQARFGPDLEWVEHVDYRVDPARAARFEADIRRFWPALPEGALTPDYAGIRPKLHGPGEAVADFCITTPLPGLITLFGMESPGLTSCLAIGEYVTALET